MWCGWTLLVFSVKLLDPECATSLWLWRRNDIPVFCTTHIFPPHLFKSRLNLIFNVGYGNTVIICTQQLLFCPWTPSWKKFGIWLQHCFFHPFHHVSVPVCFICGQINVCVFNVSLMFILFYLRLQLLGLQALSYGGSCHYCILLKHSSNHWQSFEVTQQSHGQKSLSHVQNS